MYYRGHYLTHSGERGWIVRREFTKAADTEGMIPKLP